MSPRPTLIVAALPEEAMPLLQRLLPADPVAAATQTARPGDGRAVRGRLAGREVAVAVTGDGAAAARDGLRRLLRAMDPELVAVVGLAGALTRDLAPGSLVVAAEVRRPGSPAGPGWVAGPALVAAAAREAGAVPAVVVGSGSLVGTPGDKAALGRRAGLGGNLPAVVDLESAAYVEVAEEAGVPWVVLRAVGDTAVEALPEYLERCRDEGGCTDRRAVLREALHHPASLPALLRLARRASAGAVRLADAAERLLPAIRPPVAAAPAARSAAGAHRGPGERGAPGWREGPDAREVPGRRGAPGGAEAPE